MLSKEFSYDQENDPYATKTSAAGFSQCATAEMHRARWSRLFDQMDKSLTEEERLLVSGVEGIKQTCVIGFFFFFGIFKQDSQPYNPVILSYLNAFSLPLYVVNGSNMLLGFRKIG